MELTGRRAVNDTFGTLNITSSTHPTKPSLPDSIHIFLAIHQPGSNPYHQRDRANHICYHTWLINTRAHTVPSNDPHLALQVRRDWSSILRSDQLGCEDSKGGVGRVFTGTTYTRTLVRPGVWGVSSPHRVWLFSLLLRVKNLILLLFSLLGLRPH